MGSNNFVAGKADFDLENGLLEVGVRGGRTTGSGTTLANDGDWHMVTYTFSGTTLADIRFFVDGEFQYTASGSTVSATCSSPCAAAVPKPGLSVLTFNGK